MITNAIPSLELCAKRLIEHENQWLNRNFSFSNGALLCTDQLGVLTLNWKSRNQEKLGQQEILANLDNLPFASATLPAIVFQHALDHSPNAESLLLEALRVLRPGGVLVLFSVNAFSLWHLLLRTRRKSVPSSGLKVNSQAGQIRRLQSAGFTVRKVVTIGPANPKKLLSLQTDISDSKMFACVSAFECIKECNQVISLKYSANHRGLVRPNVISLPSTRVATTSE